MATPGNQQQNLPLAFGVHRAPVDAPARILRQIESEAQALAVAMRAGGHDGPDQDGDHHQHPDGQGRITLSADHRRYANLSKECVVIGSVDYLEIWDAQAWNDYQQTHEENFSAASDEALSDII